MGKNSTDQYAPLFDAEAATATATASGSSSLPPSYRSISPDTQNRDSLQQHQQPSGQRSGGWKDVWASVLFVLHFIPLVWLATAGFAHFKDISPTPSPSSPSPLDTIPSYFWYLLLTSFGSAAGLTMVYFYFMHKHAHSLIKTSFVANIVLVLAVAVMSLLSGNVMGACFAGIYVVIVLFMWGSWQARIPFATVMLETVTSVTKAFPASLGTATIALAIHAVWGVVWTIGSLGSMLLFAQIVTSPDGKQQSIQINDPSAFGVVVYLFFSYVWTSLVISNTVHVTICGLFATFYFQGVTVPATGEIVVPVKNPTATAAKRALSTSFGSIAFGSLILAAIDTLRFVVSTLKRKAIEDREGGLALVLACLECIISLVEGYLQFFNTYAFAQVAIYGKPFCTAAHDTWELIKSRGIDLIINDDLVSSVLGMGSFLVGILSGAISVGVYALIAPASSAIPSGQVQDAGNAISIAVFILGMMFGIVQFSVVAQVIKSGVATTFVALAEDPEALKRTKPALFHQFQTTYHHIALFSMV